MTTTYDTLGLLVSSLAGILQVVSFWQYTRATLRGHTVPNTATWLLWLLLTLLNATTYTALTGDWVKALLPIAASVANVAAFVVILRRGKFSRLAPFDHVVGGIGAVAALVWWVTRSAVYANFTLLVAVALSYVPTYVGLVQRTHREAPGPWLVWLASYCCTLAAVLLRWRGQLPDLAYPLNAITLHVIALVLIARSRADVRTPHLA